MLGVRPHERLATTEPRFRVWFSLRRGASARSGALGIANASFQRVLSRIPAGGHRAKGARRRTRV